MENYSRFIADLPPHLEGQEIVRLIFKTETGLKQLKNALGNEELYEEIQRNNIDSITRSLNKINDNFDKIKKKITPLMKAPPRPQPPQMEEDEEVESAPKRRIDFRSFLKSYRHPSLPPQYSILLNEFDGIVVDLRRQEVLGKIPDHENKTNLEGGWARNLIPLTRQELMNIDKINFTYNFAGVR